MQTTIANDNIAAPTVTKVNGLVVYRNVAGKARTKFGRTFEAPVARGQHAAVVPNASITLWGLDRNHVSGLRPYRIEFKIGEIAVYGSYNLIYTGVITAIGEKTVTIDDDGKVTRMSIYDFSRRNSNFNADRVAEHNNHMFMTL
jgi:hypothetical protein